MEACLGCCGLRRIFQGQSREVCGSREQLETSRLLYDDAYRSQYGTNGQNLQRVIQQQPDPEMLRREREEMENICHTMANQVIDVFAVAPRDSNQAMTQDQARALLARNGIDATALTDSQIASFVQQPSSGRRKAIEAYRDKLAKRKAKHTDEQGASDSDESVHGSQAEAARQNWSATDEELIYKTVRRPTKTPISIELDPSESRAAKAILG